jgi:hypothetical protein
MEETMHKEEFVTTETPQEQSFEVEQTEEKDTPLSESAEETKTVELPDMQIGYVVGLQSDGKLIFKLLGSEFGMIQLLGLQQFANLRLQTLLEVNQNYGYPVVATQLQQLIGALHELLSGKKQPGENRIVVPGQ